MNENVLKTNYIQDFINKFSEKNKIPSELDKYLSSSIAKSETEETLIRAERARKLGSLAQRIQKNYLEIPFEKLIDKYREISQVPLVARSIKIIMNEFADFSQQKNVKLKISGKTLPDDVKQKIHNAFNTITYSKSFLDWTEEGEDIAKSFYIDGRLCYEDNFDLKSKKYIGVKQINSKNITPFIDTEYSKDNQIIEKIKYNYIFQDEHGLERILVDFTDENFTFVSSGEHEQERNKLYPLSFLHKALKPVNRLILLQDAILIYRLTRATEKRVFKVKTPKMNEDDQKEVLESISNSFNNSKVLNTLTGEVDEEKAILNMLEDIWIGESDQIGIDIDTLAGGIQLDSIEDLRYFQEVVLESLDIPKRYLEQDPGTYTYINIDQIEIEQFELEKFIQRFVRKIKNLFLKILQKYLHYNEIIDWVVFENDVKPLLEIEFIADNKYKEMNRFSMLRERLNILDQITPFIGKGKYFSKYWVQKNILGFNDTDIYNMNEEIEAEAEKDPKEGDEYNEDSW